MQNLPNSRFFIFLAQFDKVCSNLIWFIAISHHNSAQNFIKLNSDRAKEFTFGRSETNLNLQMALIFKGIHKISRYTLRSGLFVQYWCCNANGCKTIFIDSFFNYINCFPAKESEMKILTESVKRSRCPFEHITVISSCTSLHVIIVNCPPLGFTVLYCILL